MPNMNYSVSKLKDDRERELGVGRPFKLLCCMIPLSQIHLANIPQ